MCIAMVCLPGYDIMNYKINLIFLIKLFFHMTKKSRQKFKYLEKYPKLSFTNIQDLCSNFVDYESFFESNQTLLTFLLYVIQTWMTQLILAVTL